MMAENNIVKHNVETLVLDAGPLITQPASQLIKLADKIYTTPGVYNELKDESVRNQLIVWGDKLQVRHPKKTAIEAVVSFAKLTGDSTVLSQNDLHIIALAYELDVEANNGISRFRTYPGEIRPEDKERIALEKQKWQEKKLKEAEEKKTQLQEEVQPENEAPKFDDDGFEIVRTKRKSKKTNSKISKEESKEEIKEPEKYDEKDEEKEEEKVNEEDLDAEYNDDDDDGEWITLDNLAETISKEENVEKVESETPTDLQIKCALATGDFAAQNVALQIGINLMNTMSGLQIKRVRNYMLRCHACFTMLPIPRDNTPKHFCPSCGGATLRRIAVSVNSDTGKITPHLKKNFQWRTRGNVYSISSPLSKNTTKKYGSKGFQHRGNDKLDMGFFSEDQREYQKAIKDAKWQQRQNEKALEDFIGGGSADNCISPFFTGADVKPVHVKVGRGKFANQSRKKI
jgi:RNA-binding protein NOB1